MASSAAPSPSPSSATVHRAEPVAPPAHRAHRGHEGGHRWADVELLEYKDEGSAPFRDVTRQVLFDDPELECELRYFEVAPGGWSSLERHEHVHNVVILRGSGQALVADRVFPVRLHDLVGVPPLAWHQFRAGEDEPLGFLCTVNRRRDRPQLPSPAEVAELRADPAIAAFLGG